MATRSDPVSQIRRARLAALVRLWDDVQRGTAVGWPAGRAFEHLILRAFELEGASVVWPFSVELQGLEVEQIDGVVHVPDLHCLIEAKDESTQTAIGPLSKMRNQLQRRPPGTMGIVFARSGFTDPAQALAAYMVPVQILLWTGREFDYALRAGRMLDGLRRKHWYAIECGLPDYNIIEQEPG